MHQTQFCLVAAVASLAAASPVRAQRIVETASFVRPEATAPVVASVMGTAVLPSFGVASHQGGDHKEPGIAALLSFFLPGLGSFYAGSPGHGLLHLGIFLVDDVVFIVGVVGCADSNSCGLLGGSLVVGAANDIWSVFTAVRRE